MDPYRLWLASVTDIPGYKKRLGEEMTGSAEKLYHMSENDRKELHLFTEREQSLLLESRKYITSDSHTMAELPPGIRAVFWDNENYPERLRELRDRPYALFYKGNLPGPEKTVGIVGARMCSEGGRMIASMLGRRLAETGIQIISGMALGIDSAGQAGALEAGGKTFSVLGCGCDICYPRNSSNIYRNILQTDGGIISEYFPGTQPVPYHFPERNRIISGLSDVLVVVEARQKSGSLITADFALEQGKDIFAVPGRYDDVISSGCNSLISQGAGILYDVEVFLENIGAIPEKGKEHRKTNKILLENEQSLVYSCLDLHPKFINNIVSDSGMDLLTTLRILNELKKTHLVRETFQNYFCRCV